MRRSTDPAAPVAVADAITLHVHGWSTHLDALGHIYTDGVGYNGRRRAEIFTDQGLAANAIIAMKDGVFTRGVLLDVAACCGVPRLPTDHVITRAELQRAEDSAGVRVEACDALFVRTGLSARLAADTTDDPDRTSADDGHTIMLDLGVEQRKHRVWPVGVVLLRAGTWAGADVGQSLVAVKSW